MFGIFIILAVTKAVGEYHNINYGTIKIACDNDASLLVGTDAFGTSKID